MASLPTTPEEITEAWLSNVLGRKVTSVNTAQIMPGTATKVFITVTYEDTTTTLPTTFCIKGGFNPELIKMMPFVITIYQREVDFYNKVAPSLEHMDLPRTYWAGHSATQGIIIMDDLSSTTDNRKITFGTPSEPWFLPSLLTGVEQLAALHAKTWNVQPKTYPWLPKESHYDAALLHLMQTYGTVVRSPGRPSIPEYMKDQERMTAVLKKHYTSRNPKFLCLVHGDSHVSNTYLVDGAPRFLDWQMVHIGSAFHDVAYLIVGVLDIETRREKEWGALRHYLRALEGFGGPVLSVDDEEVVREYKKSLLAGVGPIMCPYEMQPREWVFPMAERYATGLDDHGVLELGESFA